MSVQRRLYYVLGIKEIVSAVHYVRYEHEHKTFAIGFGRDFQEASFLTRCLHFAIYTSQGSGRDFLFPKKDVADICQSGHIAHFLSMQNSAYVPMVIFLSQSAQVFAWPPYYYNVTIFLFVHKESFLKCLLFGQF